MEVTRTVSRSLTWLNSQWCVPHRCRPPFSDHILGRRCLSLSLPYQVTKFLNIRSILLTSNNAASMYPSPLDLRSSEEHCPVPHNPHSSRFTTVLITIGNTFCPKSRDAFLPPRARLPSHPCLPSIVLVRSSAGGNDILNPLGEIFFRILHDVPELVPKSCRVKSIKTLVPTGNW